MKSRRSVIIAVFFGASAAFLPLASEAARTKTSAATSSSTDTDVAESPAGKMRAVPFRGMIASVDDKARTFTIAGKQTSRSVKITDTTVMTKGGQPATMKDIVANEEVRGSYYKLGDGTLEAKTVKLGPLTEAEKADKEARKEKRQARKAEKAEAASSATP